MPSCEPYNFKDDSIKRCCEEDLCNWSEGDWDAVKEEVDAEINQSPVAFSSNLLIYLSLLFIAVQHFLISYFLSQ